MRFTRRWKIATGVILFAFVSCAGWIFYNTEILIQYVLRKIYKNSGEKYEKTYKRFDQLLQPRVRSVKYEIDLYPDKRE